MSSTLLQIYIEIKKFDIIRAEKNNLFFRIHFIFLSRALLYSQLRIDFNEEIYNEKHVLSFANVESG
jgi:hypothetical protein